MRAYGEGIAFSALAEIVRQQCGILESDDRQTAVDKLDTAKFNAALWAGRATTSEAPTEADGSDLSRGRAALLSTCTQCRSPYRS